MRKILIMAGICVFVACNSNSSKKEMDSSSTGNNSTNDLAEGSAFSLAYTFMGSGDKKHSNTILKIWKASDERDYSTLQLLMADSFECHTTDGLWPTTNRDSMFAFWKASDTNLVKVKSRVTGIQSFVLKNLKTGINEEWVSIWGGRVIELKNGKTNSILLHENWKINKDGKGEVIYQYWAWDSLMKIK